MDVLTLVAQKLSLADRVKMAGICSAWRWAALGGSRSPFDDEGDGEACQCLEGDREAVFEHLKNRGGFPKDLESARRFRGIVQRLFRFTAAEAVEMGVVNCAIWHYRIRNPMVLTAARAVWPTMDAERAGTVHLIRDAMQSGPALLLELQAWGVLGAPSFGPRLVACNFSWIEAVPSVRDLRRTLAVLRGLGVTALPMGAVVTNLLKDAVARPELGFLNILRHELGLTIEHVRRGCCGQSLWTMLAAETTGDPGQRVLRELVSWGLGREDVLPMLGGSITHNAVWYGVKAGNVAMLRVLGREMGVTRDDGPTTLRHALGVAAGRGDVAMVRVLARDFGLTAEDAREGYMSPLRSAAYSGNVAGLLALRQELGLTRADAAEVMNEQFDWEAAGVAAVRFFRVEFGVQLGDLRSATVLTARMQLRHGHLSQLLRDELRDGWGLEEDVLKA